MVITRLRLIEGSALRYRLDPRLRLFLAGELGFDLWVNFFDGALIVFGEIDLDPGQTVCAQRMQRVTTVDETLAAVERGFSDPRENSETRIAVANEMFYKPGTATDRAVSELYELMELDRA